MTSRPGELLADILESVILSSDKQMESKSTEDVLSQLDNVAGVVEEKATSACVGSGDATALYPSLRHAPSARLCGQLIASSQVKFEGVDYRTAGILIATACTAKEIAKAGLTKLVPKRRYKKGRKPTIATKELNSRKKIADDKPGLPDLQHDDDRDDDVEGEGGDDGDDNELEDDDDCQGQGRNVNVDETKFGPMKADLTEKEMMKLLAKVIEIGVLDCNEEPCVPMEGGSLAPTDRSSHWAEAHGGGGPDHHGSLAGEGPDLDEHQPDDHVHVHQVRGRL